MICSEYGYGVPNVAAVRTWRPAIDGGHLIAAAVHGMAATAGTVAWGAETHRSCCSSVLVDESAKAVVSVNPRRILN